jgi:DNA-directed RNA polymerase specialized sigma24 family protein
VTAQLAFDQYHQAVYSFAFRLTQREDIAEDITQECFLALIRAPQRIDTGRGTIRRTASTACKFPVGRPG